MMQKGYCPGFCAKKIAMEVEDEVSWMAKKKMIFSLLSQFARLLC